MSTKTLATLDIGGGTQDFLLWRADQTIENAFKMVAPSPTQIVAARIRRARSQGRDIFLHGRLMGGGAMQRAVQEHIAAGLAVWAQPGAGASMADDLERVRSLGVRITDQAPPEALPIRTGDLDLDALRETLARFETPWPERVAVAVCDHGYSPGASNRKFRFAMWEDFLAGGGNLEDLITPDPPPAMTRMRALTEQLPGVLVMDTAAAALWGALQDPAAAAQAEQGVCVVNLGNMHTVGFLARGRRVLAIYEHHTGRLGAAKLSDQLRRFIAGELSNDEVFDDMGHGCARLPEAPTRVSGPVVITGPRRRLARGLGWRTSAPFGDVMLSGCFGLAAAALAREGGRLEG